MRLYEKARKKDLAKYMADTARDYYVFQKGQSCIDVVWRQAACAEAAVADGNCVAAFACDGDQFYENFDLELLKHRALRRGMPVPIA